MGDVVGDHLIGLDAAGGADGTDRLIDQVLRQRNGVGDARGGSGFGLRHGSPPYWLGS
jgi:hypothetical protein